MPNILDYYPLPWSVRPNMWGLFIIESANGTEVVNFFDKEKADFIVNSVNNTNTVAIDAAIVEKITSIYYICWDDTFYLTKGGDWVRDIKRARMFKRKCEASNCIKKNLFSDVTIVTKDVY